MGDDLIADAPERAGRIPAGTVLSSMHLRDLLIITILFACALVLFLAGSTELAISFGRCAGMLYGFDLLRRIPRQSIPSDSKCDSPMRYRSTAIFSLLIALVIFVVFDAVESPAHRFLPNAFYDFLTALFRFLGLVMVPTIRVLAFVSLAIVLMSEWHSWASHALDPRRSPSP